MQYLYLWIDLLTLSGPLLLSFDKRVAFYKNWKSLFISIVIMMTVFIPWDIAFTINGIWGFNPVYLSGVELLSLPIEEWLFFIVVPYACVFIFECCKAYFGDFLRNIAQSFFVLIGVVLLLFGLFFIDRWYTFVNFLGAGVVSILLVVLKQRNIGYVLICYLISLIPFFIVNSILTGSWVSEPVVWYNNEENIGLRFFTIPIEDAIYLLFFYALVLIPYEKLRHHY